MGRPVCDPVCSTNTKANIGHDLSHRSASKLTQLMEGTTSGALIPENIHRVFQDLREVAISASIGDTRHEYCLTNVPPTSTATPTCCSLTMWAISVRTTPDCSEADCSRTRVERKSVTSLLAGAAIMGSDRLHCTLSVAQSISITTDLDLISFLTAIPHTRMRRGIRCWATIRKAALNLFVVG